MNAGEMAGWAGAIAGSVIGLMGGIIGTYFGIKNTNGPRERSFMIKASVACWVAVMAFLGLMFCLPGPYRQFLWIPYGVLLALGVRYMNRQQQILRQQESQT